MIREEFEKAFTDGKTETFKLEFWRGAKWAFEMAAKEIDKYNLAELITSFNNNAIDFEEQIRGMMADSIRSLAKELEEKA